ncbi:hypothetical protein Tco_0940648 [Tanacetum coccineum]|uniref:Uncharacterized protein n=1 Tax=Tanacetum coccineum TaxID=301880 RepID=A0ABQ5DR60_9ASTR
MEKIVEDLDILLSRMDIFVSEIKDTASDMAELMNIVGVVPKYILQVAYPRTNDLHGSNPDEIRYWYKFRAINSIYLTPLDFLEISKMPVWLLSSIKDCYKNNPIINYKDQLMLKFLSVGPDFHDEYRYLAYHFIQLVIVDDKDNNTETFRKAFQGFSKEGIRIKRAIRLRIILTAMETTLKRDFRTYGGEGHFSPIMIAHAMKSSPRSNNASTTKNEKDRKR